MLFKNSVRASTRTPHFTITKINWLMLFKEIIAVYSETHTKPNKYKMQHYWLSKQMVHIFTARLKGLTPCPRALSWQGVCAETWRWQPSGIWLCSLVEVDLSPWWWRQYAPLRRRFTSTRLHGTISQKTVIFMLAVVRTWNLTSSKVTAPSQLTTTIYRLQWPVTYCAGLAPDRYHVAASLIDPR
jgi:hypothetical protein